MCSQYWMYVAYLSTIPLFVKPTFSPMPPDVRQRLRSLVAFREAFLMMFRYVVNISFYCILPQHLCLSPLQLLSILLPPRLAPIPLLLQPTAILLLLRPSLIPPLLHTPVAISSHYFQYRVLTRFFVAFYHASIALNQIRINSRTFSSTQANVSPLFMVLLMSKFLQCQAIRCASLQFFFNQ